MAKEEPLLFEDSSSEVLLVIFHSLCNLFFKFHRWLKWYFFKFSLYGLKRLMPSLAGDWFESHNNTFLFAHLALTWSLIFYRITKRIQAEEDRMDGRIERGTDRNQMKIHSKYSTSWFDSDDTMTEITDDSGFSPRTGKEYSSLEEGNELNRRIVKDKAEGQPSASSNVIKQLMSTQSVSIEDIIAIQNTSNRKKTKSFASYVSDLEESPDVEDDNHRMAVYSEGLPDEGDNEVPPPIYEKDPEMRNKLVMTIKDILLFRSLDADQLSYVVDVMRLIEVRKGEVVIQQGDIGDYFYVVDSGVFEAGITSNDGKWEVVKRYEGSGSFGELGLMYDQPRAATVRCLTGGKLWTLDRRSFRMLVLKAAFKKRQLYENFVNSVPILHQLTEYERQQVVDALYPKTFAQGATIVRQGDEADGMYFIVEGEAKVIRETADGHVEKMTLGKGEYFGELALINNMPRAATVIALTLLKTAFLDRMAFERLLGPCIDLMKRNIERYS